MGESLNSEIVPFNMNVSLNSNYIISKCIEVDLPNNESGILMFVYKRDYNENAYNYEREQITILSPIYNLNNSLYSEDYFKLGTFFNYGHPNVEAVRDEKSLYLAFSYSKPLTSKYSYNYDWDRKLIVAKYKFPNFELEWQKEFQNKSIQSITVNNEELALFDFEECKVFTLNKFNGELKSKFINLSSESEYSNQKANLSIKYSHRTHHDIAFLGKNLIAMSYFNKFTMYDEQMKEINMTTIGSAVEKLSMIGICDGELLAECFKSGGKMECPQSDTANSRVYFVSDKKLMVLTPEGVQNILKFDLPIHSITFNSKDGSLLIYMRGENNINRIELVSSDIINNAFREKEKSGVQKALLPSKREYRY